ncbi:MAG TPA: tetratricopeptide repeat protein [Chitinispirillaceae bacterium]|nr:tetratricopeptide repeat protein [Chitinispirillaceae bacterium]
MRKTFFFTALFFCVVGLYAETVFQERTVESILISRPQDATTDSKNQEIWAVALIDRLLRFRLEPLSEIKVTTSEEITKIIPDFNNFSVSIPEKTFFSAAQKLKISNVLVTRIEVLPKTKSIRLYTEVQSVSDQRILAQEESDVSFDSIATGIDRCVVLMVKRINQNTSPVTIRFLELSLLSNNYKSLHRLGELFIEEQKSTPAVLFKEYEKLIERDPQMLLAYQNCARLAFSIGNYSKSAQYYKQLLDLASLHTELYYPLAQSYRLAGQFTEGLNTVAMSEKLRLKSVELLIEKALDYEGLNQRGYAMSIHQQVLSMDSLQPGSLLFLAREKNNAAQYQEALVLLQKLIKVSPANGHAFFEQSKSLSALGQYDKSYDAIKKAASLLPQNSKVQAWLGDCNIRKQKFGEASQNFHAAIQSEPDNLDLYIKAAHAMALDNHAFDALSFLRRIEQKFSVDLTLKKEIALLEFSEGNYEKALPYLELYCKTYKNDPEALLTLGKIYIQTADYEKAVSILNTALQLSADKIVCRLFLSDAYLHKKDYSAAEKLLNQVITEKPLKNAHRMAGELMLAKGDKRQALTHFLKERELHGDLQPLQEQIALLNFQLGFFVPAKTEFARLIELNDKHPLARYYLSILHLRERDVKSAEYFLADARSFGPGDEEVFYQLGSYYSTNSLYEKALKSFQQSLTFNQSSERALLGSAQACQQMGKDSAVAEIYVKLFNLNNAQYSSKLAEAGHLFLRTKNHQKAEATYSEFLKKGYKDFSVNASYSSILFVRKEYPKVISLLEHADGNWKQDQKVALMLAESYNETGKFIAALPWCSVLLSKDQNSRPGLRISANAYEKTGDTLSALSMYDRYIKLPADEFRNDFLFHSGELYEKKNLTANALARYESAIKEYPEDMRSYEQAGFLYYKNKSFNDADRILSQAIKYPRIPAKLVKLFARTNVALNNVIEAESLYKRYLSKVDSDAEGWKELGFIYFNQNQFESAIPPFTKTITLKTEDFEALKALGICYVTLKNFTAAISPLGRARTIKKNNTELIDLTVQCYRKLNETTSLVTLLREWLAIDPKRFDTKMELGKILLEEKKVSEAISMFEEAIRFIPTDAAPYLYLSKAYEMQGNDSIRLSYLKSALKYSQPNWEIHYQLARYYIAKNIQNEASVQLQKSIDLNPSNAELHFEFGNQLYSQGQFAQALAEYRAALSISPNNPLYLISVALGTAKTGNKKGGIDYLTVALGKNSSDTRILYLAGMTYRECNRMESATQMLSEVTRLDSTHAAAWEALGDCNLEGFKFTEATQYYFKSWERGGFNETRAFKLGTALSYNRKYVESRDFFETILSHNPSNEIALYKVIESSCEVGDLKKARKLLTQFKSNTTPWMQLAQGKIYETEKNSEAAITAYTIAKRIAPEHPYVHAGLGRTYLNKVQYDSAINYLSAATTYDTLNMQYLIYLGVAFERAGDTNSASLYYSEVDKRYPLHPEVHALMANLKFAKKEYASAARILERGIEYHPDDSNLRFMLGKAFEGDDLYERAIEQYQASLKIGKGQPVEALRFIGNIYYEKLVNNKKAKEYFKKYVKAGGVNQDVEMTMKKIDGE